MKLKIPEVMRAAILSMAGFELVENIDDKDEDEELNPDMIGDRITNKTLKQVEDTWVRDYLIN